jgi:hypothetical protein
MSKRVIAVWCLVLGGLLATACGEADASADASDRAEKPKPPAAEAKTTTTTAPPPPYSFDGSVPPPPLVNTGTDYEAIYRSLSAWKTWAESHSPDPAVADEIYAAGTATHTRFVNDLEILRRDRRRLVNEDATLDVHVVSVMDTVVSLRLTETVSTLKLFDDTGRVVDAATFAAPLNWVCAMTRDDAGRWRISSIEPADQATRVQL